MHRSAPCGAGGEQSFQGSEYALKIIQTAAGDVFLLRAEEGSLHAAVEVQVTVKDLLCLHSGLLRDKLLQKRRLLSRFTEKGKQILLRVVGIPVIDAAVHVDRQTGNDQKIPVNVDQSCPDPVRCLYDHAARDRQRSVQPRRAQHTAVLLYVQPDIAVLHRDLRVRLDLEHRRVAVACHDLESVKVLCLRHPERDQRGIVACDKA